MAKGDEHPERVEDDLGVDDAVVVELAEVADRRDAVLIAPVVVALEPAADVLKDLIDHVDGKDAVEAAEVVQQEGEELNVAVADLPDLGERVAELAQDLIASVRSQRRRRTSASSQSSERIVMSTSSTVSRLSSL